MVYFGLLWTIGKIYVSGSLLIINFGKVLALG